MTSARRFSGVREQRFPMIFWRLQGQRTEFYWVPFLMPNIRLEVRGGINVSSALRIGLDLYANIRPSRSRAGVPHWGRTPMDLVIVRENTEGFYSDRNMFQGPGEVMPTPDVAIALRKITAEASRRIALLQPNHPALALAEEGFLKHHCAATDAVGRRVVAETSYNIAYPMMALAVSSRKEEYVAKALRQLEVNRRYLADEDVLWLRCAPETGEKTSRSWSRGVAWYFLGLVRTFGLLPPADRPESAVAEARRMAFSRN